MFALQLARRSEQYVAALEEAARRRERLTESREAEVWAGVFPRGDVGVAPHTNMLAGGLRRVAQLLGIETQVTVGRVLEALHADANWLKSAASPEQRAILEGIDPRQPPSTAWFDFDEGRAHRRAEHEKAVQRHIEEWGRPPA